jgi:hypothetical protein
MEFVRKHSHGEHIISAEWLENWKQGKTAAQPPSLPEFYGPPDERPLEQKDPFERASPSPALPSPPPSPPPEQWAREPWDPPEGEERKRSRRWWGNGFWSS